MSTLDVAGSFPTSSDRPAPRLPDAAPPVTLVHHDNGTVSAGATDAHGNRVMITATAGAQPWLVRYAMRQLLPHLMPGARDVTDA